jgi:hypothetical protein
VVRDEADIVSDTDNIYRFGVFRILQWCAPLMDDHHALVKNLQQRVEHLEGYLGNSPLETLKGQQLFAEQLRRQVAFFNDLIDEYRLSKKPGS